MKKLVLFAALTSLVISSAFAKKVTSPLWVSDATIEQVYPTKDYIARTGYSQSADGAIAAADSELSSYFNRKIQTTVASRQSMTESDSSFIQRRLERTTVVSSEAELFAVNHTEAWYDKKAKLYYVCAYIPRSEAMSIYLPKVESGRAELQSFLNLAQSQKDTIKKISHLFSALESGLKYEYTLAFAELLDPSSAEQYSQDRALIAAIPSKIQALQQNLSVKIVMRNQEARQYEENVAYCAQKSGFQVSESGEYTLELEVKPNKTYHGDTITAIPEYTLTLKDSLGSVRWSNNQVLTKFTGFSEAEDFLDVKITKALFYSISSNDLGKVLE